MADYSKITDIRDERLNSGEILDDSLLTDIRKYPALTDELAAEALIKKYPYDFPGVKSGSFTVPTLDAMISSLSGISGENKFDDFIKSFPTKQKEWHEEIKKNPKFGERGWQHLKNLWEQASIDRMNSEILKQRDYALHGRDENGNIVRPLDYAAGKVADFFTPRRMTAYKEGRDPSISESLMDYAQNGVYMVPMGGAEALAGRAIGKIGGTIVGGTIAPSLITAGDYALGTKDYAGVPDALLDAGIGTATNLGVNKVLAPLAGAVIGLGSSKSRIPQAIRNFLDENTPAPQKARNLMKDADRKVKAHFGETNAEYADALRKGKTPARLSDEELMDNLDVLRFRDILKDPGTRKNFTERWKDIRTQGKSVKGYNPADMGNGTVEDMGDLLTAQMQKRDVESMVNTSLPGARMGSAKPSDVMDYLGEQYGRSEAAAARAMIRHPELISLMEKRTLKEYAKDPSTYADMFKSYLINQAGDDAAAQRALAKFGIDVKDLRKEQDAGRKERKVSGAASTILTGRHGDLSPESVKYLKMIQDNPSIVVTGISDPVERDSFNMWLLREGNELLRGTAAARPTWEVK